MTPSWGNQRVKREQPVPQHTRDTNKQTIIENYLASPPAISSSHGLTSLVFSVGAGPASAAGAGAAAFFCFCAKER